MPKSAAPTADDLKALLRSANLMSSLLTTAQSSTDFDSVVAGAIAQWEKDTGYYPFIATEQTRLFDPPGPEQGPVGVYLGLNNMGGGRKLFLYTGAVSVSEVRNAISTTNPTGTLLTVNSDYYLRPQAAPQYGRPYSYIEFRTPQYGIPASLSVKGFFGYSLTWPDDAWNAVLRLAASTILGEFHLQLTSGTISLKEGDEESRFSEKPLAVTMSSWAGVYAKALGNYARVSIF